MKKFTKLLGIVLIMALVMSMGVANAFAAVNITVNRDTTYDSDATGDRVFTYKQIFRATESTNHTSTGGGYDTDGTPGAVTATPTNGISYYLDATSDATQIGQLGTWSESTDPKWTKATGNNWFKLTKTADGSKYIVEWDNAATDTDTAQAAAKWLNDNYTALATGTLTGDTTTKDANGNFTKWTASDLAEGYYLISGSEGQNLVAATTDITINEKNSYPTIDKKQNDKSATDTYADTAVNVKVGDTIYYQVEVTIPADANRPIAVIDKMSTGLTYDSTTGLTLAVKGDNTKTVTSAAMTSADADLGYDSTITTTNGWQIKITPDDNTKGQTVVITFQATVNNSALIESDRKNDVTLKYGNTHYVMTDTVEYDIGAAAIIKYDGATADLDATANTLSLASEATAIKYLEATFTLTDASGNAINVKEATSGTKGVYVVDTTATTNTVTSDKAHNGLILIYGLDPEVTYTLTETATESGYNLLNGTVSLTPAKAEKTSVNTIKVTVAEAAGVTAGDSNADADHTLELTAAQVSKVENNSGTVLPSTGGIGTTIFYVVGSILVVAAGVLLITKKRMGREG